MKRKIAIHLAEGFEEVEAVSIIDLLRRADLEVLMVSMNGKNEVRGAHQITVKADILFEDVNYDDIFMIVLPGGMPGASNLDAHQGLRKQIKQFNEQNRPLAAICAAPMVYGNLGLLKGKKAVSYPGFEKYLSGAEVLTIPVVESGNVITGRGIGTALEFALKLIEKAVSPEKARQIGQQILFDEKLVTT
ncbi:MAG TPA: DJ-1 family glyoxalase III [Prolixibacteraceae bacterium]|nr:DJ-1 family glyoxalase III [Prolixibacteraceae bacterium]